MAAQSPRKPEVMSPAGYWPQLQAAIEAGADSVYFGLKSFSARAKVGFTVAELPDVMRTLHQRGVRGFVAFNTLIFDTELAEATRQLAAIAAAGADAVIIQDVGMLRLARQIAPGLEIHASTQMSITDARGVRWAQSLGAQRVTLARELSLADLARIRTATDAELEVFVHGALCVAYSGQCFSSEAWGGRSANRGQCAQACRLPYELEVDGTLRPLGDARYLLSPGDLYALHQVPELTRLGIAALKIEGRYKDAEYVALTTRAYRLAVDAAWAGLPPALTPRDELALEQAYSRGLGPHFISGTNHQAVVAGRAPRHRGVRLGTVVSAGPLGVVVNPSEAHQIAPLKPGDGLVFDAADWRDPAEPEEGGRVYEVLPQRGRKLELRFAGGAIDFSRIRPGDWVWRTHDPDLERAARPFTQANEPVRRQHVDVVVEAAAGVPLRTTWTVGSHSATVTSPAPLGAATQRGLHEQLLRDQLGRLGHTPYELGQLTVHITGSPFAPASVLNQIRREAVGRLQILQGQFPAPELRNPEAILAAHRAPERPAIRRPATPAAVLHLLVRTPEQLDAALTLRPASITLDYLDLYGLKPSVDRVQASGIPVRVASPRVLKPGEEKIADFLRRLAPSILVRASSVLAALHGPSAPELIGDFSLNAANAVATRELLRMGLSRITPTHDLNAAQIAGLARQVGPESIEAIAYQHLPVFHTEHCVFCRFLSTGTTHRDCGRPCEEHRIALRDHQGRAHPVLADVGCRNTIFGAEAQEASAHLEQWRDVGLHHFRLEFAHETGAEVGAVTTAFRDALNGRTTYARLGTLLRQAAPQGTTAGSLFVPAGSELFPIVR